MTTTTKVFVILVCLFAFILTPMAIQFAARTENWRQVAEGYRDQAQTADANARSALAIGAAEAEYYKDQIRQERERLLETQQAVSELNRQIDELTQKRDEYARSRDNWETSARLLTAQMTVLGARNETLNETKENLLAQERELRSSNLQLTDRVKELTAQVAVLDQQNKQKVQEIASYREENRKLREQLQLGQAGEVATVGPAPTAKAAVAPAIAPIKGEITEVSGSLATVNVGAASGVHEGMRMVVTRSNDFICDLEITANITPNEAVGRIVLEGDRRVRPQDEVIDAPSFEDRNR